MVQAVMRARVQVVMRVMGSDGEWQMKLLCGPAPNRPQTGTGPWPGGWRPLF